jgi:hypothetical protein
MCPALSPAASSQPPAHACSTLFTTNTASTLDICMVHLSLCPGLPGCAPPPATSYVLRCPPQVPCVSGAPDQVSDDEAPISCLHFTSPPRPSVLAGAAACLPTVMMQFPFRGSHTVRILLWFRGMVMLRFLSCAQAFLALLLHLSSYCLPSTCPAGWRPRPMLSQGCK